MLKVMFSYQIFLSNNGIYSVNQFLVKECSRDNFCKAGDTITVVGNNVPTYKNIVYNLEGIWEQNRKKKGVMQFKLYSYSEERPVSGVEILNYMSSGIIKGIGKKNAQVIFEAFGTQSLDIIENQSEKLLELKGFGKKSVKMITESYKEHIQAKNTLIFLSKFGVSTKIGMKIFDKFKNDAETIIKENPYILCSMKGIGFETSDEIARKMGYATDSPFRIEAGILWTLKLLENEEGNLGSPVSLLERRLYQLLNLPHTTSIINVVNEISAKMIKERKVIVSNGLCYRPKMYEMESECASHIVRLVNGMRFKTNENYKNTIKEVQAHLNIQLDDIQESAVEKAVTENFIIITGGPGSGKTTTILCIVKVLEILFPKKTIKLMAPTGRAARRMTESTKMPACTIHSGLRLSIDTDDDYVSEELEEDIIIVDEVSMLDIRVATLLLRAIDTGKKVIFIGDIDQLPSVGPGAVLRDIITSNVVEVVKLERIFRQNKESNIYINSRKIKNGSTDLIENTDFSIVEASDFEISSDIMLQLYREKIGIWGIENVACLTPYRKHIAGCEDMNKKIQEIVNPYVGQNYITHHNCDFREMDIVMNLVNATKDNGVDVANGDIGTIIEVDPMDKTVKVEYFGDSYVVYQYDELEELELAYSYTIHKSQGSEYKCIITNICSLHIDKMKTRNILYTAVTRATREVIIVGTKDAIKYAINNVIDNRYTLLSEKIISLNKKHNILH